MTEYCVEEAVSLAYEEYEQAIYRQEAAEQAELERKQADDRAREEHLAMVKRMHYEATGVET